MKSILKILSVLIIFTTITNCEDEPIGTNVNSDNIISVDSELYNLLERVSNSSENPANDVTCIEFIYPVVLFVFNEDLEMISAQSISNDQDFSDFLDNLTETYSISVSYPITTTLNDGSTFSIETNDELTEVIDNCIEEAEEEAIGNCEELINNCVWKIGYIHNTENTYLGGIFQEDNGATTLTFDSNIYFGSWTVLFIEEELHINIGLIDTSQLGIDMNYDWMVQYLDADSILLTNEDKQMVLNQYCEDDYDLCSNFNFEACELETNPGYAEIITEDYNYCILDILQIEDNEAYTISYHETNDDATMGANEILQDQPFLNINPNTQQLYVRITNTEDDTFYIIQIMVNIISC